MKHFFILLVALAAGAALAQQRSGLLNRGFNRQNLPNRTLNRGPNRNMPAPNAPNAPGAANAANAGGGTTAADDPGGRSIEFNQAPVDMVLKVYGDLVEKTVLKDPQAPSPTITLQPRQGQTLTDEDKIEAIETVLEMNGIHIEPYGEKFVRALPRKEVRKEGIPLIMDPEHELKESTRVVSLMLPFKYISVEDAQKTLDNFKSAAGIIIGFERTNTLLITDTEANINRMREIARTIDIATPVMENVFVRQIKNASAEEIKTILEHLVEESQKELEKNGKAPANTAAQPARALASSLLRRTGQQNQQQPASNTSLVMGISDADRGMIRGKVVILSDERSNKLIIVTSKSNMDFFDKVIEALDIETTPDTLVKVYRLKYAEAEDVSDMINDLIGNTQSGKSSSKGSQNANSKKTTGGNSNISRGTTQTQRKPANQRSGETKAGELTKDNTTVLADKRINGIVVMTEKELVPTIEQIIESMDIKLSQVLIETTIIEVGLGDGIETGMDWVQNGRRSTTEDMMNNRGQKMYYKKVTTENTETGDTTEQITDVLVPEGYKSVTTSSDEKTTTTEEASDFVGKVAGIATDGALNYYTAGTATAIGGGQGGTVVGSIAQGAVSNLFGKAFSFVFTSDELGISAIIQATKTDSRSKYIASPVIMTLDNKEATIEATSSRQFLTGWTAQSSGYVGSGMPSPNYSAKDIGITLKVTPKINPNGTVMLTLEEEYSQVGASQKMLTPVGESYTERTVDVPVTRKMSSDVILENNQTVVFGGLTQVSETESETGIPFLKDIPYIGKWLFGTVSREELRTELLVFMTPYVLDDAAAAEAEAIRRKKSLSDPRPWDDHGWSASRLADPVSKREQMRRIKDEWKKQDDERQTKMAIEKAKLGRAKALEKMSKEERKVWLEMHKDELEKEKQEELEKKMLDDKSQEELKKLAEKIRREKLGKAEKEIKKAEEENRAENERTRLDAEKKAAKEAAQKTEKGTTQKTEKAIKKAEEPAKKAEEPIKKAEEPAKKAEEPKPAQGEKKEIKKD